METNLDKNEQEQNDKKEWVSPEMQDLDLEFTPPGAGVVWDGVAYDS